MQELNVTLDAVLSDEFLFGLLITSFAYFGIRRLWRTGSKRGVALLAVTGSSLTLIHVYLGRRLWLDLAVVSVLAATAIAPRSRIGALVPAAIAAFAVIVRTGIDLPATVAGLGALGLMALPQSMSSLSRRLAELGGSRGAFVTALGVWATVPDTNLPRVLLGASVAAVLFSHRDASAPVSPLVLSAWIVTIAWIGMQGGELRPASVVGAWGSFGLLLVPGNRLPPRIALAAHAATVLVASRIAGLGTSIPAALGIVGTSVVLMAVFRKLWPTLQNRSRRIRSLR